MLGYSELELLLLSFSAITHESHREECFEVLQLMLSRNLVATCFFLRLLVKKGGELGTWCSLILNRDPAGFPLYFFGQFQPTAPGSSPTSLPPPPDWARPLLQDCSICAPTSALADSTENPDPATSGHDPMRKIKRESTNFLMMSRRLLSPPDGLRSQSPINQMLARGAASISDLPSRYTKDFEELGILGKGGFGAVFKARNRLDGVEYAVKKIKLKSSGSPGLVDRVQEELLREVKCLARLDHAQIVRYYQAWVDVVTTPKSRSSRPTSRDSKPMPLHHPNQSKRATQPAASRSIQSRDPTQSGCRKALQSRPLPVPRQAAQLKSSQWADQSHSRSKRRPDDSTVSRRPLASSAPQMPSVPMVGHMWSRDHHDSPTSSKRIGMIDCDECYGVWEGPAFTRSPSKCARGQKAHKGSSPSSSSPESASDDEAMWVFEDEKEDGVRGVSAGTSRPKGNGTGGRDSASDSEPPCACSQSVCRPSPPVRPNLGYSQSRPGVPSDGPDRLHPNSSSWSISAPNRSRSVSPGRTPLRSLHGSDSNSKSESSSGSEEEDGSDPQSGSDSESGEAGGPCRLKYGPVLFIQMQLCNAQTLHQWKDREGRQVSCEENADIIRQLAEGLKHVHTQGIIHRDLKPSNIFLIRNEADSGWHIKIGDFGLSKELFPGNIPPSPMMLFRRHIGEQEADTEHHTPNIGTLVYAAPEQISGKLYNEKVDIYSLGIVAFEMYHPFTTQMERIRVLTDVRSGLFPDHFHTIYPKAAAFVRWLLDLNPSARPSAAEILQSDLFSSDLPTAHIAQLQKRLSAQAVQLQQQQAELDRLRMQLSLQHSLQAGLP